ncbi:MAG: nickel-responsive transcriptional regulator NikR [Candidatus Bipolaricaulota bacterium]|nr:nickel-responsive transcriptional regulator NikR [Candidatus Bipolaricaulota bacterium]MBS3792777.1 nickel-responsive transcriptional regulator NikR [Candidatus Bipolaricaulota bacterium]
MTETQRFGVSMSEDLLSKFDNMIANQGYRNRSEAIRDMIRNRIVEKEWEEDEEVMGVVTLLYNHHKNNLSDNLTHLQHKFHELIISTTHLHVDADNCLELIAVQGHGKEVRNLANELTSTKGVIHGKLLATSTGADLS